MLFCPVNHELEAQFPGRDYRHLIKLGDGEELEFVDWPDEPRHQLLLENQWTRIYVANISPGLLQMSYRTRPAACSSLQHTQPCFDWKKPTPYSEDCDSPVCFT